MYVTPSQKRRYFITTIILLIALPLTVVAGIMAIRYFTGAGGSPIPQNVVMSNLTSNSITISWTTDTEATGSVTYNAGKGDSAPFLDTRGNDRRKTHYVEITDLDPEKEYSFVILSNGDKFTDEKGKAFKFKTSPIVADTPVPKPVYGSLEGDGKEDAIVYVLWTDSASVYPASASTTASGKWIIDLSALRNPNTSKLIAVENTTDLTIIAKSQDTLSGTANGTYQDLVNEEGELIAPISLSDAPSESIYSQFPEVSLISMVQSTTPETPETPEEPEEPEEPETPVEPDDDYDVGDSIWSAIPGTVNASSVSVDIDEDSVIVSNLTDTGFNVVWVTDEKKEGYVKYGTTATELSDTAYDERDSAVEKGEYYVHNVKLPRLQPSTKYYFEIYSGNEVIKDGGSAFSATTYATLSNPPEFKTVTGKIKNYSQASDVVVIVQVTDKDSAGTTGVSTTSSALTDLNGNWVVTLGDLRKADGSTYYTYSDADSIEIKAIAYANSNKVTRTLANIEDAEISITISDPATTREIVKVAKLKNYNVYPAN